MAWVTPPVFVSGNVLTAAQLNILSGDLNTTAAALASAANQWFVSTAANVLAARLIATNRVDTSENTTSAVYVDLATVGPAVTSTTGTGALAFISAHVSNTAGGNSSFMGVAVSSATTIAAADTDCLRGQDGGTTGVVRATTLISYVGLLTVGSNIFTAKYRAGGTGTFSARVLTVMPM